VSRLTELLAQLAKSDTALADDLRREVEVLSRRRQFGLNFERHVPESVRLPNRRPRRGDKVVFSNGAPTDKTWVVVGVEGKSAEGKVRLVEKGGNDDSEATLAPVDDLIVVAEFRDAIYPGLRSTGKVERGATKPYHTVINGENFHVLQALSFVCRGKVDCIYIDPPYNSGARDWKYNNDYVDAEDAYRHSKWLAMMERRLLLAKELLDPAGSALVVAIDEKEYLRLGLLLEQVFPETRIQMVSSLTNPASMPRQSMFGRTDEYLFFVFVGSAVPVRVPLGSDWVSTRGRTFKGEIRWDLILQSGPASQREDSPNGFYPVFIDPGGPKIHSVGDALPLGVEPSDEVPADGLVALWPIRKNGTQGRWRMSAPTLRERIGGGWVRVGGNNERGYTLYYLSPAEIQKIHAGVYKVTGHRPDGSPVTSEATGLGHVGVPSTQWRVPSHDATQYGSRLLEKFLGERRFPFPKSLFAVEDALRFLVADKPDALVLDFFAGSGTTAHALMRLNHQDGGRRRCVLVTNNEVSEDEASMLGASGHRPGDPEWEALGICEHITKPRIRAAITGHTPDGEPIKGDYKFADEFPMSEGFEENAEFFDLTYEDPERVRYGLAFEAIAPLLWLRAGSEGTRVASGDGTFVVADTYAILFDLDSAAGYVRAVREKAEVRIAYLVTDDETQFQVVAGQLPQSVEAVRLYAAYLDNFRIQAGA
jgi:adenine-specific DNA-methyltransferase